MSNMDGKGNRRQWGANRDQRTESFDIGKVAAPAPDESANKDPITSVQIDALVYLQIMKHGNQQAPGQSVHGQLLGLDEGDTLQVTHSFGYATPDENTGAPTDSQTHSLDMLRRLREVNVDSYVCGWYNTTHLGQFFNMAVIEGQYQYQSSIPRAVLLVYDPLQSSIGKCAFKALQLTPEFMTSFGGASEAGREKLAEQPSRSIFAEIPVSVSASLLAENFLVDWAITDPFSTTSQVAVLDVENQAFMEKNVQLLTGALEELAIEQQKIVNFERNMSRKGDEKGGGKGRDRFARVAPRPLDTMIISQQIKNHCKSINTFAGDSFGKIYLMSNKPTSK